MIEEALSFLRNTPPFSVLDEAALRLTASDLMLEFHPKGETIIRQDGPIPEYLGIIKAGSVKIFMKTNEGEEIVLDKRGEGDFFGFLSLISGEVSKNTVVATEDTTCYLIRGDAISALLGTHPAFSEYFLKTFLRKLADMTYQEVHDRTLLYGGGDKILFTSTVDDLAAKKVITAPEDATIREAALIMSQHKISSLVLLDPDNFPSGIVTDRDLRDKVVARGRDPEDKVKQIMSVTLIKSGTRDYCYEALLKMIRYNIHHLLVVDRGRIRGMITNHDLMMIQGTSPLSIARDIEHQTTLDSLFPVARKINRIVTTLIREGARSSTVTRIITEINDRLLKKILSLVEKKAGPPPVGYCWIVLGSEGRKEQTFRTDQDNAIIYAEPPEGAQEEVRAYFSGFAVLARDALEKCGFPTCPADYMASNPKWCQPVSSWERHFSQWVSRPTPEAVLLSLIFFDFRPVHGDILLAERLRAWLGLQIKRQNIFFGNMAGVIVSHRPAVGFFGRFLLEKQGDHKGTFNLKFNAIGPIVDAARLFALESGIFQTSTVERLRELKDREGDSGRLVTELEDAFEFLMSLRLRHQYRRMQDGREPDNFISPRELSSMDQRMVREAFRVILAVQNGIRSRYAAWMNM